MRRAAVLALLYASAHAGAAFAADAGEPDGLRQTRAILQQKLKEAEAAGIIAPRPYASQVQLREGPEANGALAAPQGSCFDINQLSRAEQSLGDDPYLALHRMRGAASREGDAEASIQLATIYLAMGFAEEARAVTADLPGAAAAGLTALALLGEGRTGEAADLSGRFQRCGALGQLIAGVAAVAAGERETLPVAAQTQLQSLPRALQQAITEALAGSALMSGDGARKAQKLGAPSTPVMRLALAIAQRRATARDYAGAAKAIGVAFADESLRSEAATLYRSFVPPSLNSTVWSEKLVALAAIARDPELAGAVLSQDEMKFAAGKAATLGAFETAEAILSAAGATTDDIAFFRSKAAHRHEQPPSPSDDAAGEITGLTEGSVGVTAPTDVQDLAAIEEFSREVMRSIGHYRKAARA